MQRHRDETGMPMMQRAALSLLLLAAAYPASAAPVPRPAAFGICATCHKAAKGAPNGIGPNLWGIGNTKAGVVPGFAFSPAMKSSAVRWTRANLVAFAMEPRKVVPGTRMAFAGLRDRQMAERIADYILSLK